MNFDDEGPAAEDQEMHEEPAAVAGAADQDFLSSPKQQTSKVDGGSPMHLPTIHEDSDSVAPPKSKAKASARSKSKRGAKEKKTPASKKK